MFGRAGWAYDGATHAIAIASPRMARPNITVSFEPQRAVPTMRGRVTTNAPKRSPLLPLLLGVAMTLTLRGYQYGGGNHGVYLIAPLREVHPELLANDWWTT